MLAFAQGSSSTVPPYHGLGSIDRDLISPSHHFQQASKNSSSPATMDRVERSLCKIPTAIVPSFIERNLTIYICRTYEWPQGKPPNNTQAVCAEIPWIAFALEYNTSGSHGSQKSNFLHIAPAALGWMTGSLTAVPT